MEFSIMVYYLGHSVWPYLSHYSHREHLHPISQASAHRDVDRNASSLDSIVVSLLAISSLFVETRHRD